MEQLTLEEMDTNAKEAAQELFEMTQSPIAEDEPLLSDVAKWWKKHYLKCGHKRLGRILLKFVPEED